MTFFERLEVFMEEKSLSQKDIAMIAEVKPPSVNEWKTHGTVPKADAVIRLAKALNTSVEYLITGVDDSGFSHEEKELIALYRRLDQHDKGEINEIINLKIKNAKKGDSLSSTETA
jgi:transcriptional regulator with XRE-family HTH domain